MVPKASDDLPDPEIPVKATRASRGASTSTPLRLCTRVPKTRTHGSISSLRGSEVAGMLGSRVPAPGLGNRHLCDDLKRRPPATHRLSGDAPRLDANP